eukprot:Nk52_evm1s2167 gene=Nk52_evmTU1s2167
MATKKRKSSHTDSKTPNGKEAGVEIPFSQIDFARIQGSNSKDPSSLAKCVDALLEDIVAFRRDLHSHPEPGFEELRTREKAIAGLRKYGVKGEIHTVAKTGFFVDIRGEGPPHSGYKSRCVALRTDMDALRMTEQNKHLSYRSSNEGIAHMCGHDGHMATMLATAALIQSRVKSLPGNFTFRMLWQPAEEGPGGAEPMIKEGCLEGVDECYGYHIWGVEVGKVAVKSGPFMAHVAEWDMVLDGRGGHASQPHANVDAVLCASAVVQAINSVISRNVHYNEQAVVGVSTIHGGEVHNVQPDMVKISGTIRDFNPEVYKVIHERLTDIAEHLPRAYGCTGKFRCEAMYPVVVNHVTETEYVREAAARVLENGRKGVTEDTLPCTGAEDMSYFLQERPGCFFFVGGKDPQHKAVNHATNYDYNDRALPCAIGIFVRLLEHRAEMKLFPA